MTAIRTRARNAIDALISTNPAFVGIPAGIAVGVAILAVWGFDVIASLPATLLGIL
jgi:hypothetical protein